MREITEPGAAQKAILSEHSRRLTEELQRKVNLSGLAGVWFMEISTGFNPFKCKNLLFSTLTNELSVYEEEDLPLGRKFAEQLEKLGYSVTIKKWFVEKQTVVDDSTREK